MEKAVRNSVSYIKKMYIKLRVRNAKRLIAKFCGKEAINNKT